MVIRLLPDAPLTDQQSLPSDLPYLQVFDHLSKDQIRFPDVEQEMELFDKPEISNQAILWRLTQWSSI